MFGAVKVVGSVNVCENSDHELLAVGYTGKGDIAAMLVPSESTSMHSVILLPADFNRMESVYCLLGCTGMGREYTPQGLPPSALRSVAKSVRAR